LSEALTCTGDGILLRVRVAPRSQRDEVAGIIHAADGSAAVRVRVRAVAEDGKGNRAVIEAVAAAFDVAKSTISIKSGETSRNKILLIAGNAAQLQASIAAKLAKLRKERQ
jgi:uncharacterized protein